MVERTTCVRCTGVLTEQYLARERVISSRRASRQYTEHEAELRLDAAFAAFESLFGKPCPSPRDHDASDMVWMFAARASDRLKDQRDRADVWKEVEGPDVCSLDTTLKPDGAESLAGTPLSGAAQPDEALLLKEDLAERIELLSRQSPDLRQTVVLKADDRSYAEIAWIQDIPQATARKRIERWNRAAKKEFAV
jgi:hypothetical protein